MASRLGVTRIQKRPSRSAFEIHGKLSGVSHTNNGMVTRVNISLDILDPSENTIWSREIKGKSITFSQLEGKAMINLAIEDAMGNAEAEL